MKMMIAKTYDDILEESKIQLCAEKQNKIYIGALFFEPICEKITEIIKTVEIPDNASCDLIARTGYDLLKSINKLAKDGSTYGCLGHWAWCNGLADKCDFDYKATYNG